MMVDTDCPEISTSAAASTHTSDRKSARPQRIEVITRGERRRWSLEEKQAIVAESLAPNASLTAVARRHGIGTGLLYAWRHQLLGRRSGEAACFARLDVMSEPHLLTGPGTAASTQRLITREKGRYRFWIEAFISHGLNAVSFPSVVAGRPLVLCPCRAPQIGVESRRRGRYTNFYQLRGTARSRSLSL